jgi:hypothetical protein
MYKDRDATHHEMSPRPTEAPSYPRLGAIRLPAVVLSVVLLTAFGGGRRKGRLLYQFTSGFAAGNLSVRRRQ